MKINPKFKKYEVSPLFRHISKSTDPTEKLVKNFINKKNWDTDKVFIPQLIHPIDTHVTYLLAMRKEFTLQNYIRPFVYLRQAVEYSGQFPTESLLFENWITQMPRRSKKDRLLDFIDYKISGKKYRGYKLYDPDSCVWVLHNFKKIKSILDSKNAIKIIEHILTNKDNTFYSIEKGTGIKRKNVKEWVRNLSIVQNEKSVTLLQGNEKKWQINQECIAVIISLIKAKEEYDKIKMS